MIRFEKCCSNSRLLPEAVLVRRRDCTCTCRHSMQNVLDERKIAHVGGVILDAITRAENAF